MLRKIAFLAFIVIFASGITYGQTLGEYVESEPTEESIAEEYIETNIPEKKTGQELIFSGEMKTGIYWERILHDGVMLRPPSQGQGAVESDEKVIWHNNDDAGENEGRFRLNFHLINHDLDMGMKVRFQQTAWSGTDPIRWDYAFAYGDFFGDQLRLTLGKLDHEAAPWAAGGPDLWNSLEGGLIGMRFEFNPNWLKALNIGFVLNQPNYSIYNYDQRTMIETLKESVVGIAYTHDFFHARFSWRFDGEADVYNDIQEGMDMMFRLEERIIRKFIPGLSLWATGWYNGISDDERVKEEFLLYRNFLYTEYDHSYFTTQLRLRYEYSSTIQRVGARLSFYYHLFDRLLSVGTAARIIAEVGEYRSVVDVPFKLAELEPQLRLNLNRNAYLAFVYCYRQEYVRDTNLDINQLKETQWFNMRAVYSF